MVLRRGPVEATDGSPSAISDIRVDHRRERESLMEGAVFRRGVEGDETHFADSLARSAGFTVESTVGRVGIVEEVHRHTTSGDPVELVVRAGRLGRRVLFLSAEGVEMIIPRERRLILRADFAIRASEPIRTAARAGTYPSARRASRRLPSGAPTAGEEARGGRRETPGSPSPSVPARGR